MPAVTCIRSDEFELKGIGTFRRCLQFTKSRRRPGEELGVSETTKEKNMRNDCLEARIIKGKLTCITRGENPEEMADGGLGFIDDFGYPGELNPAYGALAGGGATMLGVLGAKLFARKSSAHSKYAGLYGLAAGGLVSVGLMAFPRYRRAGYMAGALTLLGTALELVRSLYVEPKQLGGDDDFGGYYGTETAGAGERMEILGDAYETDGAGPVMEILGQSSPPALAASPADVMGGLGLYQPEMTGFQPFSGTF